MGKGVMPINAEVLRQFLLIEDFTIRGAEFDAFRGQVRLLLEHPEIPDVQDGSLPCIEPHYRFVTKKAAVPVRENVLIRKSDYTTSTIAPAKE